MTFQPIIPSGGLVGWRYLSSTLQRQVDAFSKAPQNHRDIEEFQTSFSEISSADELVENRQLLKVALGAFGLSEDINSQAFIKKIIDGGVNSPGALANRLADDRYKKFAETFQFEKNFEEPSEIKERATRITDLYSQSLFEAAVGEQNEELRLALFANRELPELARRDISEDAKWYTILGNPPLRSIFESALSLPSSFSQIDIEQQVSTLKDLSSRRLGIDSISELSSSERVSVLLDQFILQRQVSEISSQISPETIALTLLRSS